jgi:putative ABC transport system permease protein
VPKCRLRAFIGAPHYSWDPDSSCAIDRKKTAQSRRLAPASTYAGSSGPSWWLTYSNDSPVTAFAQVAETIRTGAFVVSAIALLAAGIGIMNIMLVSITERTHEIGLRKAIGARRPDILRQFLIEAVVLSEVGGIAGIICGVLGGSGVALYFDVSMVFPWGWAITGLLVCSAIGITFGLYPAWRAPSPTRSRR